MNPWKEKLGCEVNLCQAKHCDAQRMEFCALRKAYLERVAWLKVKRAQCRSQINVDRINKILRGMDAE